ncbi:MAG TPA: hypothetical protein PKZ36_01215 [Candidatus Paceibacterota bacterium]|nr:hypothetical protein [Candidatus Paceibacterota bacterium]HPT18009.1 hypothetical protein [Candidatus Paceibacterota bacterium]
MFKKGLIIFFTLICLFFGSQVNAQVKSGNIVLSISPQYPKAGEEVQASVSTYSTDLNNSRISWIVNGTTKLEGVGKKTFSFRMENSDFQTVLEVKIETLDGSTINKQITISSTNVDMLWEAYNTYTPPFYKGKTLATTEGMIKVVAFPNTTNLIGFNYKWEMDNKSKQDSSGYGRNYFIYKNSFLEDSNTIGVNVSDIFGNSIGEGTTTIKPGSPIINFYRKDRNLGIKWENILENGFSINREDGDTIIVEPYFLYPKDFNSADISWDWLINGEKVQNQNPKNSLSVKLANEESGNAIIKVMISNTKTLFESVEKQLNVNF